MLGIQDKEFNFYFIRLEDFVSHGVRVLQGKQATKYRTCEAVNILKTDQSSEWFIRNSRFVINMLLYGLHYFLDPELNVQTEIWVDLIPFWVHWEFFKNLN